MIFFSLTILKCGYIKMFSTVVISTSHSAINRIVKVDDCFYRALCNLCLEIASR